MTIWSSKGIALFSCAAALLGSPARAEDEVTLPAGTTIEVATQGALGSDTSRAGDTFLTTVRHPVRAGGWLAIPAGSTVEGRVVEVRSGDGESGAIAVEFVRLMVPGNDPVRIRGALAVPAPDEPGPRVRPASLDRRRRPVAVIIGQTLRPDVRATTLVGTGRRMDAETLSRRWATSRLAPGPARVGAGGLMLVVLDKPVRLRGIR